MSRIPTIRYASLLKIAGKPATASLEDALLDEIGDDAGYDLVAAAAEYRRKITDALEPFGLVLSGNDVCGPNPKPDWWANSEHPRFQDLAEAVADVNLYEILDGHRVLNAAEQLATKLERIHAQYQRLDDRIDTVATAIEAGHPRAVIRMWAEQPPQPQLLLWSSKDDLTVPVLRNALSIASGRLVNVYEVNTGTEDICVVISAVMLTDAEVHAVYDGDADIPAIPGGSAGDTPRVAEDLTSTREAQAYDTADELRRGRTPR